MYIKTETIERFPTSMQQFVLEIRKVSLSLQRICACTLLFLLDSKELCFYCYLLATSQIAHFAPLLNIFKYCGLPSRLRALTFDALSFATEHVWEKQRITKESPLESSYQSFWCGKRNFYNVLLSD